jgi:hypothetical protein
MSFITESKKAYRQVEALEKETSDHEISMARGELEGIADKALATSAMLQGVTESGNPLPAWVQSKITNASDYITSVHDYLKYTPGMNESFNLEENTFEKIYQMQQDGKSTEDIAKELKLNPALVKKVLGENTVISEGLSDAQIAQLKKEYEPLKGKTITTSQYQQLKNILFKLQDGDLEKLQKQNIPFASTGAGSILRVRKSPVKITSVKVPGLEGMAEENQYVAVHVKKGETSVTANSSYEAAKKASEKFGLKNTAGVTVYLTKKDGKEIIHKATEQVEGMAEEKIPQDYLDYLRTIVYKKVDFYEIPPKHIIQHWKDEPNKDRFKGKIIDYKEGVELQEKPSIKQYVVFHSDNSPTKHKEFKAYDETELNKQIGEFLKQNPGYKVYGKSPSQSVKEAIDMSKVTKYKMISIKGDQKEITIDREDLEKHLKLGYVIKEPLTEEPKNPYAIGMAAAMKATGDTPPLKKSTITKAHKIADKVKEEEVELKPVPSLEDSAKKHNVDIEVLKKQLEKGIQVEKEHTKDEKTAEKIALAHLDERPDYYDQLSKVEKQPVKESTSRNINEGARALVEAIAALQKKADKTGMPYSILKQVYDRGMAAWKGGHRPGASQHQWAFARVNSFVTKSSGTWGGADSDLAKKVKGKE